MGLDHPIGYAALHKKLLLHGQGFLISTKHHIALLLRRSIAAFQPIARIALGWWKRNGMGLQRAMQHTAHTLHHTLSRVHHPFACLLDLGQLLQHGSAACHREIKVGWGQTFCLHLRLIGPHNGLLQTLDNSLKNGTIFFNRMGRKALITGYGNNFHFKKASALVMSEAWSMSITFEKA